MAGIMLHSPSFSDHALIPRRHARDGENRSPALDWSEVPEEAVELALICEDPDAPGGPFVHWVLAGLDPTLTGVREDDPPSATAGRNDFGGLGYDGPEPPVGDGPHRYFFRVYAAKQELPFSSGGTAEELRKALQHREIASGTLVGTYER